MSADGDVFRVRLDDPGARDEGGFGFSANGARSLQNNFLLDGVDNNSNLPDLLNETNYVIQPSVEAIEEFKAARAFLDTLPGPQIVVPGMMPMVFSVGAM